MNRFDRITAILIQLQSKRVVKAQDLADRFDISLRTVYRDIRTLEEAGVPLYGEAGVGYSLVEGYRLPPVMFSREEAIAFLTAEKLMEKFTDDSLQNHFSSAMYKVKAVLRGTEKDLVENLENQIMVTQRKTNTSPSGNILDTLLKAISDKKVIKLEYKAFGNEESLERKIEPIGVFHEYENWYTIGYCHLRDSYRQFRLDRVVSIELTDELQQERTSLKEFNEMRERAKASLTLQKVIIKVDKAMALYIQEHKHYYGFVSEKVNDDYIEMTFLTQSPQQGFVRWLAMFGDQAELVEPLSLKTDMKKLLERISEKMNL
ncbi:WYL domain-containing protein [Flavobacterium rakeshii]|uniref:WYL domain-containing protein n=1 Tax=Flavobacterium rakeshii TaxID=1038845 RepID=A0A6N8HH39_9FLAO|nr:YafY family protein [Flavobacterium rakeshii]MUV04966.1 WYL domain-containing protein [Flavobacterium rakeshii]